MSSKKLHDSKMACNHIDESPVAGNFLFSVGRKIELNVTLKMATTDSNTDKY